MLQASGMVVRGVGKVGNAVEAKRIREIIFLKGHRRELGLVASAGAASVHLDALTRALPIL